MAENTDKIYPNASSEVAQMFNLEGGSVADSVALEQPAQRAYSPVDLPVVETTATSVAEDSQKETDEAKETRAGLHEESEDQKENKFTGFLKALAPYAAIFGIGLFLYYFFFSGFSFLNVFKNLPTTSVTQVSDKQTRLEALQQQDMDKYLNWMRQFYFEITDAELTDPNKDLSGNGLSNFQKYLMNLNPKAYDSLGLGMADGQAILSGINPGTGQPLTDEQKKIVEEYFDIEVIANRISASALAQNSPYGPASLASFPASTPSSLFTPVTSTNSGSVPQGGQVAGTSNYRAPQPTSPRGGNRVIASQSLDLNSLGINTSVSGKLDIPDNKISVPIIWTKDTKNFDRDLKNGIVHYPGTVFPGDVGTSYLSGHSSNYAWVKSRYNQVFANIDKIKDGTSFTITVTLKDGSTRKLHYVVRRRQTFKANDQAQFTNSAKPTVALSTCWPVGSTANRYVIYGEQTQVEK